MKKRNYKRTGMSATTQSRKVCAYLKKIETKKQLEELKNEKHLDSVSTLVRIIIEEYLANIEETESKADLKMKKSELETQINRLERKVRKKKMLIDSLVSKNEEYLRKIEFLEKKKDRKPLDKRLIWLLQESTQPIKKDELCKHLRIDRKDDEAISSLQKNLEFLIDSELVTVTKNGWVWLKP